jgi:hypothetical protein
MPLRTFKLNYQHNHFGRIFTAIGLATKKHMLAIHPQAKIFNRNLFLYAKVSDKIKLPKCVKRKVKKIDL